MVSRNLGIFSAQIKYGIPSNIKARPRALKKKARSNCINKNYPVCL
jgi:hypothetical protein